MAELPFTLENYELTRASAGSLASFDAGPVDPVRQFFAELEEHGSFSIQGSDLAVLGASGRAILVFQGAAKLCSDWPASTLPAILLCLSPSDPAPPWAKALSWTQPSSASPI